MTFQEKIRRLVPDAVLPRPSLDSYSHRKQWVIDRLQQLTNIFTIDICAYAVMSNHYHLVLHVDKERAQTLSEQDVIARWKQLFGLPMLVEHYHKGLTTTKAEANRAKEIISLWRSRLYDISWFMVAPGILPPATLVHPWTSRV